MSRQPKLPESGIVAAAWRIRNPVREIRPLSELDGVRPPALPWYAAAMATHLEVGMIDVEGAAIETLYWGERGRPGILLIHGSSAHARWWGPVAPLLARGYRVAAFSWSGTGGSDWRDAYAVAQTAREAWAVAEDAGLFDAEELPMVVGHSFGGKAAAVLAAEHGDRVRGTIFIDSLLVPDERQPPSPSYQARQYDSEAAALARFRFAPDQLAGNLCIADDIARASLRDIGGYWSWRFDPQFYAKLDFDSGWSALSTATCPLAFIRGADSVVLIDEDVAIQRDHTPPGTIFVTIPDAHHHIMVDQPIALVTALDTLAQAWRQ